LFALANATYTAVATTPNESSAFFWSELFALTASAIAAVLITFIVQNYMNRPKIRGSVFSVLRGEWVNPERGLDKAVFWPYVSLTNYHQNAIYPLDYEFEADFGEGYVKLARIYGDWSKVLPEFLWFTGQDGEKFKMQNLGKHLLYKNTKPIQYGDFIHGFVMFAGDLDLRRREIIRAKFTCIDFFRKRHTIKVERMEYLNFNLFSELLEISWE
jgi:hypothetical protein